MSMHALSGSIYDVQLLGERSGAQTSFTEKSLELITNSGWGRRSLQRLLVLGMRFEVLAQGGEEGTLLPIRDSIPLIGRETTAVAAAGSLFFPMVIASIHFTCW